jgi:hypothetical protein
MGQKKRPKQNGRQHLLLLTCLFLRFQAVVKRGGATFDGYCRAACCVNEFRPPTDERKKQKRGSRRIKKKSYGDIIGNDQFCTADFFFFIGPITAKRKERKEENRESNLLAVISG